MSGPTRILISALGGEGGGVLAGWLTDAAIDAGYVAQRTSVPGVAQRTGSTTYYIEMVAAAHARPVLALAPTAGEIDLFIATELLEAGRLIQAGFVTPDRTMVLTPTRRVYAITEKIAMTDGRADMALLERAVLSNSRDRLIGDFEAVAEKARCQLNAVLFGLACRALDLPPEKCRAAICKDGRAQEANVRGFDAGYAWEEPSADVTQVDAPAPRHEPSSLDDLVHGLPDGVQAVAAEGVSRLTDFQGESYARLYLERLAHFEKTPGMRGDALAELARQLALRMSSEDVVRVAQLKLRAARLARVRAEARARPGEIVRITEFLKPGPYEIFSMLPAPMGRLAMRFVRWTKLENAAMPIRLRTTGFFGFLQLKALSSLRGLRPRSMRAAEERAWIEEWLSLVQRAAPVNPEAAGEIIATAELVRGYGDTWTRGHRNWRRIADEIIRPMLDVQSAPPHFADAVLQARLAAVADPDGERLDLVISSLNTLSARQLAI
jgi:indolepyruvate ferredoxin oxidoreductase beta subunit